MTVAERGSRAGEVLNGKYQLEQLIGAGGMGEVYRAVNTGVDRTVAIKTLRPEYARNKQLVERFLREAKANNLVQHPNVAAVLDVDRDQSGVPFMVQEFLEGEDLSSILDDFPDGMPPGMALTILLPVIECVGAAHAKSVVHRDLKPENVFLAKVEGVTVPKVLDFGISKLPESDGAMRLTSTHVVMGSPAYMSPEQIQTPKKVDVRSDVWSLGVMIYELLSGCLPFDESGDALLVKICRDDPIPLEERAPHVPAQFAEVVAKCLKRDPNERFRNASHLATQFAGVREVLNVSQGAPSPKETQAQGSVDPSAFSATILAAPQGSDGTESDSYVPCAWNTPASPQQNEVTAACFPLTDAGGSPSPPPSPVPAQAAMGALSPASVARAPAAQPAPPPPATQPAAPPPAAPPQPPAPSPAQASKQGGAPAKVVGGGQMAQAWDLGEAGKGKRQAGEDAGHAGPARQSRSREDRLSAVEQFALKRAMERERGDTLEIESFFPAVKALVLVLAVFIVARLTEPDALQAAQRMAGESAFWPGIALSALLAYAAALLFRQGAENSSVSLIVASFGNFAVALCLASSAASLGPMPALSEYIPLTSMLAPWSAVVLGGGMVVHGTLRGMEELRQPGKGRKLYGGVLCVLALAGILISYQMGRHAIVRLESSTDEVASEENG